MASRTIRIILHTMRYICGAIMHGKWPIWEFPQKIILIFQAFFRFEIIKNLKLQWPPYSRFVKISIDNHGMMSHLAYEKIYDLVYNLPDLDIIEIGGGAGAGSIAIASAMQESNKKSRLIVIEKCEGGSRAAFGDYQTNLNLINNNFKRFGIENIITLFPKKLTYENGHEVISLIKTNKIAALIIDADGRIDRDFFLFWPFLNSGGLIIIDDFEDCSKYLPISDIFPSGKKETMTYRLLNQLMEWGLFEISCIEAGKTVFGYKPPNADFNKFDLRVCERIIKGIQLEIAQHSNRKQKSDFYKPK